MVAEAGARVSDALKDACRWLEAGDRTDAREIVDLQPHLLLVESADPRALGLGRIRQLVAYANEATAPSILWLSEATNAAACPAEIRSLFDVVFCTDPGMSAKLTPGSTEAVCLPHAASRLALSASRAEPEGGVGLIVESSVPWELQFLPMFSSLLAVASEHNLSALAVGPLATGLPLELEPVLHIGTTDEDRIDFIRRQKVIVTATPLHASSDCMPAVVFDAVAMGTPVVLAALPSSSGALILPRVVGLVSDEEQAARMLAKALTDGEFGHEWREAGRASVRHAHTYVHRLATLASSVGIPVIPDPEDRRVEWRSHHQQT